MKLRRSLLVLAVAAATLTACSSEGSNGSGGDAKAESTPVSWPTPENGQLTPELCGLLTVGDFIKLDVATTPLTGSPAPDYGPNAVSCRSLDGNGLLLSLQPDAVSASLFYTAELNRHNEAMASRKVKGSAVEKDGIVDAAESWFDLNEVSLPEYPEYDLSARRGSLVVNLHLAARETGDAARAQARTTMATLIGLVLERAPGLGEETTGAPHIMTMTVRGSGTGPVDIQYFDPVIGKMKRVSKVTLPWVEQVQFGWFGTRSVVMNLSGTSRRPTLSSYLSCVITVDGQVVVEGQKSLGFTSCSDTFAEKPAPSAVPSAASLPSSTPGT